MRFSGTAFFTKSSVRYEAVVDVTHPDKVQLMVNGEVIDCERNQLEISQPVGQLPIQLQFPSGWLVVIERSPQLNIWLRASKHVSLIDKLESNLWAWLLATIACIGIVIGSYLYVLPWGSGKIAEALPDSVALALGERILDQLDQSFEPSELSEAEQQKIRQRVSQHSKVLGELPYQLEIIFRSADIGANAFALPGGKIVILDDLVELAGSDQQLDSIIMHEMGHVHHRHMFKKLIHSSVLAVGVSFIAGDSTGIVDNLAGVGVFFLANAHSQEAEGEADEYAKQAMLKVYGTSEPMAEMFESLRADNPFDIPEWLSTHPDLDKRIQAARE